MIMVLSLLATTRRAVPRSSNGSIFQLQADFLRNDASTGKDGNILEDFLGDDHQRQVP